MPVREYEEYYLESDQVHGKLLGEYDNTDEFSWEDACYQIKSMMKRTTKWYVEVKGFGWQRLNCNARFDATSGRDMLLTILPSAECSFRIYKYGKNGIAINNVYHDSNIWGVEWYYIVPESTKKRYMKEGELS